MPTEDQHINRFMSGFMHINLGLICLIGVSVFAPYSMERAARPSSSISNVQSSCELGDFKENGTLQFLVYFDLDKSNLSKKNLQIVQNAAKCVNERKASSVTVVGHTDQVGNEIYNHNLSRKRAHTVDQTLLQNAVPKAIISVDWRGMFEPAVTFDNSKTEPLNRRVVITLTF